MTTDMQDSIERETLIAASLDRVWELVTEPGFWVAPTGAQAVTGETTVARNEKYGDFPVRVEKLDPKTYAAYRWAPRGEQELRDGTTTLIEFTLTPEGDGTRLRVVESGFTALEGSEELRRKALADNTGGWLEVMEAFKKRAEGAA